MQEACSAYIYLDYEGDGEQCELEAGHDGLHVAHGTLYKRTYTVTWEQEPEPEREARPSDDGLPTIWASEWTSEMLKVAYDTSVFKTLVKDDHKAVQEVGDALHIPRFKPLSG